MIVGLALIQSLYPIIMFQDPCDSFVWTATGPGGFDDAMYDLMYKNYLSQLNVENCGAVVAAPDDVRLCYLVRRSSQLHFAILSGFVRTHPEVPTTTTG